MTRTEIIDTICDTLDREAIPQGMVRQPAALEMANAIFNQLASKRVLYVEEEGHEH